MTASHPCFWPRCRSPIKEPVFASKQGHVWYGRLVPPGRKGKHAEASIPLQGKETGSGGAPASKSAQAVKPGKAAPAKEAAVPPPEIKLPPTPEVLPRPVEEGKIVYLKMSELHPFHTFQEHPYKVQDNKAMDDLVGTIKEHG